MFSDRLSDLLCVAVRMYLRRCFNLRAAPRGTIARSDINAFWATVYSPVGVVTDDCGPAAASTGAGAGAGAGACDATSADASTEEGGDGGDEEAAGDGLVGRDMGGVGYLLHIVDECSGLSYNSDDIAALVHRALVDHHGCREAAASMVDPLPLTVLGEGDPSSGSPKPSVLLRLRNSADQADESDASDALAFCLAHHFLWSIFT